MSNPYKLKLLAQEYLGEPVQAAGVFGLQRRSMALVGGSTQPDLVLIPAANPSLKELAEAERMSLPAATELRSHDLAVKVLVAVSPDMVYLIQLDAQSDSPHRQLLSMQRKSLTAESVEVGQSTYLNLSTGRQEVGLTCSTAPFARYGKGAESVIGALDN